MDKFVSHKIISELEVILGNLQGRIVLSDLLELNRNFFSDSLYKPIYCVVLDFRDSSVIGYRIDVADYIKFFRESVRLTKTVNVGILYNTPNQEFLFKIYKTFGKLLRLNIEIFRDIDVCLNWMGFSESEQELIKETLKSIKEKNIADI